MLRNREIYFYLKDEEHGWLSNFYPSPFILSGGTWPTNEHYYQAKKAASGEFAEWIRRAPNPYHAMKAGRALRPGREIRENWEHLRSAVMLEGLRAKFAQNPELEMKLIATRPMPIHEDSPTDMYWGIKGEDMLGRLLMRVRAELPEE